MAAVRRWLSWGGAALSPLTIALAYLLLSVSWILFSDQLVSLIPDRAVAERLQSLKGTLFVAVTSVLIFVLIARYRRLLLAEAEARAIERRRRAEVDRFLGRLRPARTPEATAGRICRAIASLPAIKLVSYLAVDRGGLFPIATNRRMRESWPLGRSLPEALAREMRERAEHGAWLEDATIGDIGAVAPALRSAGLRDAILAPVRHDGMLVGVLVAAAAPPVSAAPHLEAVVEVGRLVGARLGPVALARRHRERQERELRRAAREVRIVLQPIVELARGRAVGYEALARFADGASTADRFAEATALGLGPDLEEAAIRRAVGDAAQLPRRRWLALNLSAALLLDRPRLAAALAGASRPIVIELSERQPITDYARIRASLAELGPDVRLAIDDMGEAFSGLRHLVELTPAYAKLDLALVRDIDSDPVRQALISALRHYAIQTGAELIAEGIESAAERRTLRSLGVRLGQGFLFGRPAAVDQVISREHRSGSVRRLVRQRSATQEQRIRRATAAGRGG
ncbi:MAG: EAL domain-containing protein [Chloroflexota bacterium]